MSSESKSPGWIREGALWTYQRPETRTESHNRAIRENRELRERWQERLGEEAFRCPKCGSGNYEEWLIGWRPDEEHYHDPNRKACCDCGHWWWIVCPTCGHNEGRTKESYFEECDKWQKEHAEKYKIGNIDEEKS